MMSSVYATAVSEVEVVAYADEDDKTLQDYRRVEGVRWIVGPRIDKMTVYWNECFKQARGDVLMQANDDIIFRTKGWDAQVEAAFAASADKIIMAHGDDLGCHRETFGPHPFVHRRWIEAVGYFIPPYFSSDYGDSWINWLANRLGRRRSLPFVVEHMHYFFGKAAIDQTTQERLDRHGRDNPEATWKASIPRLEDDARKLRAVMARPRWSILILTMPSRAEFLKRLLDLLRPQAERYPDVEILTRFSDSSIPLGENRQRLRNDSLGEYVCFVDDDDLVALDYVDRIYPLLDGQVDYVGFQVQTYIDGNPLTPTYHSLRYKGWTNDARGNYRDISHLNPIRRELAMLVPLSGGYGEDARWAGELASKDVVKTESYVDDIMYFYRARTQKSDPPVSRAMAMAAPVLASMRSPLARSARVVMPGRRRCPRCGSGATGISNGVTRCNQCAHQF